MGTPETPRITPDLSFLSYSRYNRGTPRTPLSPRTPRTPRSSRTGGPVADYEPRGIRAELGHLNSPRSRSVASRDVVSSRRNGGSVVSSRRGDLDRSRFGAQSQLIGLGDNRRTPCGITPGAALDTRYRIRMAEAADKTPRQDEVPEELKPMPGPVNHQDSVFGNAFGSRSYYVVHPEWISEEGSNPQPQPLHRPPWPWEQPRYRVNMQVPITYESPDKGIPVVDAKKELEKEEDKFLQEEIPPISYQLSQMYKSTHPEYMLRF